MAMQGSMGMWRALVCCADVRASTASQSPHLPTCGQIVRKSAVLIFKTDLRLRTVQMHGVPLQRFGSPPCCVCR